MGMSVNDLLRKAILTVGDGENGDFGGPGQAGLAFEQVTQFIELMTHEQVILPRARRVTSSAPLWEAWLAGNHPAQIQRSDNLGSAPARR